MSYNQKMTHSNENQRLINIFRDEISTERTNIIKNYRTSIISEDEYFTQMGNITQKEYNINSLIRVNNEKFNECVMVLTDINNKIDHLKMVYQQIYQKQSDDIKLIGKSDFKNIPETGNGFNGIYCILEKDGFFYYLYENYAYSSIIQRKSRIDECEYLNNAEDIHAPKRNKGYYFDDDTIILSHYIDEFTVLKYNGKYYHADTGSRVEW